MNGTPIVPILDHCRTFQSYRIRQSHIALKPGKGNMLCIFSICPYVHRMTGCCVLYVWAYVQGSQKFRDAGRPLFSDSEIEIVQNRFETCPHLSCHAEFGRIGQTVRAYIGRYFEKTGRSRRAFQGQSMSSQPT